MAKLTKRALEAMDPPAKGKQSFLWDSELRGFGVRLLPSGLQTFILQYRNTANKERRINLGRFGVITVEQARDKARIKLGAIAAGEDPADTDDDPHHQATVAMLCDWYLTEAEAGRILGRRNRPIKKSTLGMDKSRIETHIKPLLGDRLAHTLKVADIEGMQSDIVAGKTAKSRGKGRGGVAAGGPGVASRAVGTLQAILGHAARLGKIENHPSRGARKLAGKRKTRRLSVAEIKKLGMAMRHAERNGEHPVGLAIVRLLLLTGFRISEGQAMQRAWIHADAGYISFPDTKGDAQVRAIGPAAAKLIASQPVQQNCPYVFPSDVGDGHFTASKACLARLCASVGIEGVTPHTLRHTFGSVAGDLGFSELTIRALLGHAAQSVTQGYVHIDEALKLAVTRTCDEIASLLDSSEEKAFLNAEEFQAA
ncbi:MULTISPECIES: tyrosine-type recombinase/integrase [Hyphomicrobiales]|jgi:integrase|uniref:Phage integrase family protein n=2 Tax=Brucella TaxID=234 RepID=A0A256GT13_9HYPH|nr:site-specific integrase [Brucella lupini]KAB2704439.1 site-specific integrase [Brucella lupini]KAB2763244.1 site-specific integrase [Brucella anthropi]OYR30333.1 phage integrase family protein [Brucella lupini]